MGCGLFGLELERKAKGLRFKSDDGPVSEVTLRLLRLSVCSQAFLWETASPSSDQRVLLGGHFVSWARVAEEMEQVALFREQGGLSAAFPDRRTFWVPSSGAGPTELHSRHGGPARISRWSLPGSVSW